MSNPTHPTKVRFFLMVDHVDQTISNKLVLVGTFDRYFASRTPDGQLIVGGGSVVAQIQSSLAEGVQQTFVLDCVNDDEEVILQTPPIVVPFLPSGPGKPWSGVLSAKLGPMLMPDYGDYRWRILRDGVVLDECPFDVAPPPAA